MPQKLFVAWLFIWSLIELPAQVYHYETGKAIPLSKPGQIIWKEGVFQNYPSDFGTLAVLENPNNPKSRLINIPVIKIHCLQPDSMQEPYFALHGGPGESNLQGHLIFTKILLYHDVILMGYRGVDGSVSLEEPYYQQALISKNLTFENKEETFKKAANDAIRYFRQNQIEWEGYCYENIVNDIHLYIESEKINHLSFVAFSFGTMVAQIFNNKYPKIVNRNIFIGARPIGAFQISDTLFFKQINLIHKKFVSFTGQMDTTDNCLNQNLKSILDNTVLENAGINPVMFHIYFFSQFYMLENAYKLFDQFHKSEKTGSLAIIKNKMNEFYKAYPNMKMGDLLLKKRGYYDYGYLTKDSINILSPVIESVNAWYSPFIPEFELTKPFQQPVNENSIYYIFGDSDVASPFWLFQKEMKFENQSNIYIIENCSHLDFFYTQKEALLNCIDKILTQ